MMSEVKEVLENVNALNVSGEDVLTFLARMLTIDEAAKILGRSRRYVEQFIKEPTHPELRLRVMSNGGDRLIPVHELFRWQSAALKLCEPKPSIKYALAR